MRDGEAEGLAQLFLLTFDVAAEEAEKTRSFLTNRGASVEIIRIPADRLRTYRISGYVSASTYSRLLLPEFFDNRWDRLLYLDADTRIMAPLQSLLDTHLRGRPIGAVHDYLKYLIYGMEESRTRLALRSNAPYFNAGVICFDWRATLASGLLRRAQAFATESAHLCKSHDQDALNKAFEREWAPLDPRWNFMTVAVPDDVFRLYYSAKDRPYISHFAGPVKPWMVDFPERFEHHRAWYRDVLRDSPWPYFAAAVNAPSTRTERRTQRLRSWFLVQRRRLQGVFKGPLVATSTAASRQSRNLGQQKSLLAKTRREDGANPKLVELFDQMIAEAAGSDMRYSY